MLNPNIYSLKLDDEESSLKWYERWLDRGQENAFMSFEEGRGLEDRMISKVFFLLISWQDKSKVLLGPTILFELGDELECRLFSFMISKLRKRGMEKWMMNFNPWIIGRWVVEDSKDDLEMFPNMVLVDSNVDETRCIKLASWKEDFEIRLYSSGISSVEVSNEEEEEDE